MGIRTASPAPPQRRPQRPPPAPSQGAEEEEEKEEENKEEEDVEKDQEEDEKETGTPGAPRVHRASQSFPPRHGPAPLPLRLGRKGLGRRSGARRGGGGGGASSAQMSLTYQKRDDAA